MLCQKCGKKLKAKKFSFDYSDKCGIPNTFIDGAKQYNCVKCSATYTDLGSVDRINMQICSILLSLDIITRAHVSYIRKEIFCMSYFEFSDLIGVNPNFLRDVEAYKRPLSSNMIKKIQDALFTKMQRPRITLR